MVCNGTALDMKDVGYVLSSKRLSQNPRVMFRNAFVKEYSVSQLEC